MRQKKLISLLCALFTMLANFLFAQTTWDGTIGTGFASGTGTSSNPYVIRTGPQLGYFLKSVSDGNTYSGKYISLGSDITASSTASQLVISTSSNFAGTFDGSNHKILGVKNVGNNPASGYCYLFYTISGSVCNLTLNNVSSYYGGLCYNVDISGLVFNCYSEFLIGRSGWENERFAIAYNNNGQIVNCYAKGLIDGGRWDYGLGRKNGGIVYNNNSSGILLNCTSEVTLYNGSGIPEKNKMYYSNSGLVDNSQASWLAWKAQHPNLNYDGPGSPKFTVTFYDSYGLYSTTQKEVVRNEAIGTLPIPSADCDFMGWTYNEGVIDETFIVESDITLFASWLQRIKQQPTVESPTVIVNDKAHASYQWYKVSGTGVNYNDWVSTNTANGSTSNKSYTIVATYGQKLTFDWRVSSESYDKLKIVIGSTTLVEKGGIDSGHIEYSFPSSGTYTLTVSYTKDGSASSGEDKAYVTNIHYGANDAAISGATSSTLNKSLVVGRSDCYCQIVYSNSNTKLVSDTIALGILASSISLDYTSIYMGVGDRLTLTASVLPENASNKSLTWSSSNTSVATVSASGYVTAVGNGNATITAKTNDGSNLSATCSVSVSTLSTSLTLNTTSVNLNKGNTYQLYATVYPTTASNQSVTWSSSNTSVATVSAGGYVTAVGNGNATITAKTKDGSNLSATCNVIVSTLPTSISLNWANATIESGESLQLIATILPSTSSDKSVTWTSYDTSIATVDENGLVTGVKDGYTSISARTSNGLYSYCSITVKTGVKSIAIDKETVTITNGQTYQLNAILTPSVQSNYSLVSWSSSNGNVVKVNDSGLITAIGYGSATITAKTTDGSNLRGECIVYVDGEPRSGAYCIDGICYEIISTISKTAKVSYFNDNYFYNTGYCDDVIIPEECTINGVVYNVIKIGDKAFNGSVGLKNITIPKTIESIGKRAFYISGISNLYIPNGVVSIGSEAFSGCTALQVVSISSTVSKLEDSAFLGCKSIQDIYLYGEVPCSVRAFESSSIFYGLDKTQCTLHVPAGCIPAYKTAELWKEFENIVEMEASVNSYDIVYLVDGEEYQRTTVEEGSTITLIEAPTKEGYTFSGWSGYPESLIMPDYDITITGTFTKDIDPAESEDTDISGIANTIYFDNAESIAGSVLTLSVKMKNSIEATGFQFDLYLPEGVSVVQDADGFCDVALSTERTTTARTNAFDSTIQRDGALRVLAASTKNYAFSGNDGEVCTIKLKMDDNLEPGNYPLILRNIELTNNAGGTWNVDYIKRTVTIVDYVLGDANGDTRVSVGDFSAIASHIMGVTPEGFVAKAADVNTDDRVSVGDLSAVVSMIMNGGVASAKARNTNVAAQENSIYANATNATSGIEAELVINLSNTTAVTAMQFDVCLPEGISIVENGTSLNTLRASHTNTFDYAMMEDNSFRVLAASTSNALIDGNDGEIVRIRVRIDKSVADGEYPIIIRNAEVADNAGRSFLCDDMFSKIIVNNSPTGIDDLSSGTSAVYYDLNGVKKNKMHNGMNIIMGADGTVKKVMK